MLRFARGAAALSLAAFALFGVVPRAQNATAPHAVRLPYLYVLVDGGVVTFELGSTVTPGRGILVPGNASAIACDKSGLLYVANSDFNAVDVYSPGGKKPVRTIIGGLSFPKALVFDKHGYLYVTSNGNNTVAIYPPGASKPSATIAKGLNAPTVTALGPSATYTISSHGSGYVTSYGPNGSLMQTIKTGIDNPVSLAISPTGALYAGNLGSAGTASNVAAYSPGQTSPAQVISQGVSAPEAIAFDDAGTLYVANATAPSPTAVGWISEYGLGATRPGHLIRLDRNLPTALALDASRNLYVATVSSTNSGSLFIFSPAGKLIGRFTRSLSNPTALAVCP